MGRGEAGLGFGLGKGLGFLLTFSISIFLFLVLIQTKLFEFKQNLNSTPMHSNKKKPCTSMNATQKFNPMINFNYLSHKIELNAILDTINLRNLNKAN